MSNKTPPKNRKPQSRDRHRRRSTSKRKSGDDLRKLRNSSKFQQYLHSSPAEAEIIVFDIETTGGNPERNGLTEFCGIKIHNGEILDEFHSLINPEIPIPPIVRKMTGINDKMVKNAPKIDEVMPKILKFIAS